MRHLFFTIVLVLFAVVGVSDALWAQTPGIEGSGTSSVTYLASSQWISGEVDGVETAGKYTYVRLNGIQYRLMPQVSIARRVPRNEGAYDEVPANIQDLRRSREVTIQVQGFRIYQILIIE
jgi:hypothetical protein